MIEAAIAYWFLAARSQSNLGLLAAPKEPRTETSDFSRERSKRFGRQEGDL